MTNDSRLFEADSIIVSKGVLKMQGLQGFRFHEDYGKLAEITVLSKNEPNYVVKILVIQNNYCTFA